MVVRNLVRGAAAAVVAVVLVGLGAVPATAADSNGAPVFVGPDGVTPVTGGTLGTWPGGKGMGTPDGTLFQILAPADFACAATHRPYFFLAVPGHELPAAPGEYVNYFRGTVGSNWAGISPYVVSDWGHFSFWSQLETSAYLDFVTGTTAGTYSVGYSCGTRSAIDAATGAWYSTLVTDGRGGWRVQEASTPEAAPVAPTGVTVTPGIGNLAVAWDAVEAFPNTATYQVSITDKSGSPVTATDASGVTSISPFTVVVPTTSAAFSGLPAANGPYAVTVTAVNAVGPGPASDVVSATPLASSATGGLSAEVTIKAEVRALVLTVPSSGKAELAAAAEQADGSFLTTGRLGDIRVDDTRSVAEQTAWAVQATVGNFVGAATKATFSQAQLGTSPTVTGTGLTRGADAVAGAANPVRVLATAKAGSDGTVNADLRLLAPANTAPDTYSSTVTIDLVKS